VSSAYLKVCWRHLLPSALGVYAQGKATHLSQDVESESERLGESVVTRLRFFVLGMNRGASPYSLPYHSCLSLFDPSFVFGVVFFRFREVVVFGRVSYRNLPV
jgi:hypothetical protein